MKPIPASLKGWEGPRKEMVGFPRERVQRSVREKRGLQSGEAGV